MKMKNFPNDLVLDILARLPVKTLIQLKCVCKSWHTIVKDPAFISKQLFFSTRKSNKHVCKSYILYNNNKGYSYSLLSGETLEISETYLQPGFDFESDKLAILNCVNGIICLIKTPIFNEGYPKRQADTDFILWNPATRQIQVIPKPIKPLAEYIKCGFGYDAKTNDYKFVQFDSYTDERRTEVYCLSTNSWKSIDHAIVPKSITIRSCFPRMFSLNGNLSSKGTCSSSDEDKDILFTYNFSDEAILITPMPDLSETEKRLPITYAEMNNSLVMVKCSFESRRVIKMWVLSEYGCRGFWTKLYTIGPVLCRKLNYRLEFRNNGEFFVQNRSGGLALCNVTTQEITSLGISVSEELICAFQESLVSVHRGKRKP